MRGKIDLGQHKLANVYRPPARKSRGHYKRSRMEKMPGGNKAIYRALWFMVDGAVRDAFANHPEYLTEAGRRSAANSITKRVTGTLMGYATQVARGRSMQAVDAPPDAAASVTEGVVSRHGRWMRVVCLGIASWVSRCSTRTRGGLSYEVHPKFKEGGDG
jgi:hypothetical protein